MDWLAVDKKFRPQVTPETKPDKLFRILSDMIDPLHDAHTYINAKSIQKRFHGFRPSGDPMQKKNAARITEIIETRYVRGGLRDFCKKKLQFGLLHSSYDATPSDSGGNGRTDVIGYLRIHSFSGYSNDHEFLKQLDALEAALDDIFKDSAKLTALVIDVRINGGGSDVFGISIASRLATQETSRIQRSSAMIFMIRIIEQSRSPSLSTSVSGQAFVVALCFSLAQIASALLKHSPWRCSTAVRMSSESARTLKASSPTF